jgi:hypothetical protein
MASYRGTKETAPRHVPAAPRTAALSTAEHNSMTTIRTLSNQAEAAFLLSVLQDHGFDAVLLDEGSFHYSPLMCAMRLQVPDDQASEALTFLRTTPEIPPGFESIDPEPNDSFRNA